MIAAQRDGLEVLRSHDRADAAAAGVAPFVADGGETHQVFAGFADGGNARRRDVEFGAYRRFAFERAFAAQVVGAVDLHLVILDENV